MTYTDPAEAMQPTAAALAVAVADRDRDTIADLLTPLDRDQLYALAILYAAHVDLDRPLTEDPSPAWILATAVRRAAGLFGTTPEVVLGTSRIRNHLDARAVAMTAARWAGLTSTEIGRHFGKDHTTVLHAAGRVGETPRLRSAAGRIVDHLGRGELEDAA